MRKRSLVIMATGGTILVAALVWFGTWHWGRPRNATSQQADVEVKNLIELGSVPNGTLVQVPFTVTSHASRSIVLTGFTGSCTCQAVYELIDGVKRRLAEVTLEPGSSRTFYSEINVSGEPGNRYSVSVHFRDAKETNYQVMITYIPVTSVYALPRAAVFGDVLEGESATREVEIRSDGSFASPLDKVTSSLPDLFDVTYIPPTKEQRDGLPKTHERQYLLGRLCLTLKPQPAGPCHTEVVISSDGKEILRLPVSARIVANYQLNPGELLLPRTQSNGDPIYHARVVCRAGNGRTIKVEPVTDSHLPFEVRPSDLKKSGVCIFDVQYTGPPITGGPPRDYKLRFKVLEEQREEVLTLPVRVLVLD